VRYFANRTWHACDVTSNQRPSSHVSSHITGSPVRSSQITKPQVLGIFVGTKVPRSECSMGAKVLSVDFSLSGTKVQRNEKAWNPPEG